MMTLNWVRQMSSADISFTIPQLEITECWDSKTFEANEADGAITFEASLESINTSLMSDKPFPPSLHDGVKRSAPPQSKIFVI